MRTELHAFQQAASGSFNPVRDDLGDLRAETRDGFAEMRARLDGAAADQEQIRRLLTDLTDLIDRSGPDDTWLRPHRYSGRTPTRHASAIAASGSGGCRRPSTVIDSFTHQ